jgi:oligopeptide/dipeptide ABC transporter ATP-binding protein
MIAMALACAPRLLIADEPTSALDVTIQAQILELIANLQQQSNMALMIITHDLGVVAQIADNVLIMYLGESVEYGPVDAIYHNAKHPYTQGLIKSVPRIKTRFKEQLVPITGNVPSLYERPSGCPFHTRCPHTIAGVCNRTMPDIFEVEPNHTVKCHLYTEGKAQ